MLVTNIMAVSLDGRIASRPHETDDERLRLGFTSKDDFDHLMEQLRAADAVVVGSSSLQASGQAFALHNDRGRYPIWAVLSQRGLPPEQHFYQQAELPRWIVSQQPLDLPPHQGTVRNLVSGNQSVARATIAALAQAGCERVLLFGGASVNREFYQAGLVDRLIVTICPLIVARSEAVPLVQPDLGAPIHFRLSASQVKGNLVILSYDLIKKVT